LCHKILYFQERRPQHNYRLRERSISDREASTEGSTSAEIHGGSQENRQPARYGMFSTLDKYCSVECFKNYINSTKNLRLANIALAKVAVKKLKVAKKMLFVLFLFFMQVAL
jgi:hypothetical protein